MAVNLKRNTDRFSVVSATKKDGRTKLRRVCDSDYKRGGDGLMYRSVNVSGHIFDVPRNINRLPGGWQIRLNRKGAKQFNKSFADSKKPTRGRYASLSDTKYQPIGIEAALAQAVAELKRQYKKGGHARPHEVRTAASSQLGKFLGGVVTGISTKIVMPPANRRERSPYVLVQARMGNSRGDRMLGTCYRSSIFSMSDAGYKSNVRKALVDRKFMEMCRETGKIYRKEGVNYLTLLEKSMLIHGVDISDYCFSDLIRNFSVAVDVKHLDYKKAKYLISNESFQGIVVTPDAQNRSRRRIEKTFVYDQYETIEDAQLIASLYCFFYDKPADIT